MKKTLALLAFAVLSACMLVDDFGPAWTQAAPDKCVSKIASSLYYTEFQRDPEGLDMDTLAHALKRPNGKMYLLFKKNADDKGGRMYRFDVVNGIFQRYRVLPTMRKTFEENYPNAPVSLERDTIRFGTLGEKEWDLIDNIATQPEYWEIEDQTLYNTFRDPSCRFDDRDLSKIEN